MSLEELYIIAYELTTNTLCIKLLKLKFLIKVANIAN